jgi:hypothetical protein
MHSFPTVYIDKLKLINVINNCLDLKDLKPDIRMTAIAAGGGPELKAKIVLAIRRNEMAQEKHGEWAENILT